MTTTALERVMHLPIWRGPVTVAPLGGGITNVNFVVQDTDRRAVVRIGDDIPVHQIMRFNELAASRAAFAAGISPEVLHHEPGVLVLDFITGRTMTADDLRNDALLDQALGRLQPSEAAAMPPFAHQALVRADARAQDTAQAFLNEAAALATELPGAEHVTVFPAVPMSIQRVANVERAQMLLESPSRAALQRFLAAWQPVLRQTRQGPAGRGLVRWAVDVDPLVL